MLFKKKIVLVLAVSCKDEWRCKTKCCVEFDWRYNAINLNLRIATNFKTFCFLALSLFLLRIRKIYSVHEGQSREITAEFDLGLVYMQMHIGWFFKRSLSISALLLSSLLFLSSATFFSHPPLFSYYMSQKSRTIYYPPYFRYLNPIFT